MVKKYLITGATGYIGSMLAEQLIGELKDVTVIVRNPDKLKKSIYKNAKIIKADIVDKESVRQVTEDFDYLVHCAAVTQSAYMISNPVETAESIVVGTENILQLAVRCRVQSMVFLSSMEVYGKVECKDGRRVTEEEQGEVDISQVRSCYPMAKRMAENFCHLYYHQYGVPVKIARLAQTFGRGVGEQDKRVFAQFAAAVRDNIDIVMHTNGASIGNYCDIDDVLEAIMLLLDKGKSAESYNIVNEENTMSILQMANLVANKIAHGNIGIKYEIPTGNEYGYATESGLRLSGMKMKKMGWTAKTNLEEMYRRMLNRCGT